MVTNVIKRDGRGEPYDKSKIRASVIGACREVRVLEGEAALIAERVVRSVEDWIRGKVEVTTRDIGTRAFEILDRHHADAAYAYSVRDYTL